MRGLVAATAVLLLGLTGCVSKSRARADAQAAYQRGLLDAQRLQQQQTTQRPTVMVRGEVRKPVIPWTETLTLSRAFVAAEYLGLATPRSIVVTRRGEAYRVNPKRLLSGAEDPMLEPGDLVDIVR